MKIETERLVIRDFQKRETLLDFWNIFQILV